MISIKTIASGSSGNCYRIDNGKDVLMVEAGIRFPLIREAFGFRVSGVSGCLLTHEHKDHSKAVREVCRAGVGVYMSQGTSAAIGIKSHRIKPVLAGRVFRVGSFRVLPFDVQHDADEPFGFLIQSGAEKILFATDTYYLKFRFTGLTHIMIECNYRRDILEDNIKAGVVDEARRYRIIRSHFEFENVKKFLAANDLSKVREIHLIHISSTNGDPVFFRSEIEKLTGLPVYVKE